MKHQAIPQSAPYAICDSSVFMSPRYVSLFAWSIFIPSKAVFYTPSRIAGAPLLHQPGICLSRLISRAFFFSPDTFSPATARRSPPSTQHTFERVTIQELLHHLHIAHFRYRPRFIHPGALYTCGSFSPHTRLARNLKYLTILKNVSGMCCFILATSSRCVSLSVAVSPVLCSR